jgi:DNA polymerase-3 subunit beta
MKFAISRNDFYKSLQKVINVIPAKTTVDIAYNVLVIAEDDYLKITATDLEITQIAWTKCSVQEEGAITVPGKLLFEIIREMPEIDFEFSSDLNLKITINSGVAEYKLSGQSKNEFPSVPVVESDQVVELKNNSLKRMIEKTVFACSTDNIRPALTGVYFQIFEKEHRMVATDGHRLAKIINTDFTGPGFTAKILIPTKALNFVGRNLEEGGTVQITIADNVVLFELPNTKIFSRLITEPYPDYERVVPINLPKNIQVNKADLVSAVKRVSLFANPLVNQVVLKISNNLLTIIAHDIDFGGEGREDVKCLYEEEDIELNYNAIYFMDLLRHIDADKVVIKLEEPGGPGIILPSEQNSNEDLLMLIMPVRTNSSEN